MAHGLSVVRSFFRVSVRFEGDVDVRGIATTSWSFHFRDARHDSRIASSTTSALLRSSRSGSAGLLLGPNVFATRSNRASAIEGCSRDFRSSSGRSGHVP